MYFSEFQTRFDKRYLPSTYYDLQTMTKGISLLTLFYLVNLDQSLYDHNPSCILNVAVTMSMEKSL